MRRRADRIDAPETARSRNAGPLAGQGLLVDVPGGVPAGLGQRTVRLAASRFGIADGTRREMSVLGSGDGSHTHV